MCPVYDQAVVYLYWREYVAIEKSFGIESIRLVARITKKKMGLLFYLINCAIEKEALSK